ncbi:transglutaminaseTgpA domain-containing protein [Psychromicrobium sp. YIM B11713]|uniref:transglutaminase family protein n=1 Tax=Psychromicrobium sp. YIM B11713 TaxID=3145233 RepID=UPI00374F40F9
MTSTLERSGPASGTGPLDTQRGGSARSSRPKAGSAPWAMAGAIFFAVCGTALGLSGVVRGTEWIFSIALTVAVVLAAMALSRTLRLPAGWAPVGGAIALILELNLVFFSSTAYFGVIPSPGSLAEAGALLQETSDQVIRGVAPIPASTAVVFVMCLGVGLAAILSDVLAVGLLMPATSGLALLVIALIPGIIKVDSLGVLGFVLGTVGYLLILAISRQFQPDFQGARSSIQWLRVLSVGTSAVVIALLISLVLPGFSTGTFPQGSRFNPFGPVSGLSPFLSLGSDLRNPSGTGQISYATSAENAPYLRTVTIEDFNGDNWEPTDRGTGIQLGLEQIEDGFAPGGIPLQSVTTQINTFNFSNEWLPAPYAPALISGLSGRWSVDSKTLTVKALDEGTLGQSYLVQSLQPVLTPAILRQAVSRPHAGFDPIFMTLPPDTPSIIKETALQLTGRQPTPYDKAMAIQQYLRGPEFNYSLQAPVSGGYDGSSMDALAKFLQVKSGYCVHFSAAMATMAREAGIPSRIAVGFAPGVGTGETVQVKGEKLSQYAVDGRLAHAWPELYFEGLGWVAFEPTPSRGQVPGYALPPSSPQPGEETPEELPKPVPSRSPAQTAPLPLPGAAQGSQAPGLEFLWFVVPGLLVLLLLTPALSRELLRRNRLASETPRATWAELQDTALDFGLPAEPSDTPRRFAQRLRESGLAGTPGPPLDSLLGEVERSSYGPPGAPATSAAAANDFLRAKQSLRLLAPLSRRLRAIWFPSSTLRRWAAGFSRVFRRKR